MIKNIIELLGRDKYLNGCKDIQIAKGLNEIPKSFREILTQVKRSKKANR